MARTIMWLGTVGLALALLLGGRDAAAQESQADPATWGLYTRLVGSTRQSEDGYRLHWRWSRPGEVLVEEYIAPASGRITHTNTITLGPRPGTLDVHGSSLGGKRWHGTLQPDGSVVYAGTGLFKMSHKAMIGSDGAYEVRMVKLRDGVVVSMDELMPTNRYLPVDEPDRVAAPAPAMSAAEPAPSEPAVMDSVAIEPALDPGQLARQHALNQRYWAALTGPAEAGPGRWWRAADGAMYVVVGSADRYFETVWMAGADGNPVKLAWSSELDATRGSWTKNENGRPVGIARVASATDDTFQIEALPELGMTPDEAVENSYQARVGPASLTLGPDANPDQSWEWRPESEVLALFEQRIATRKRERAAAAASLEAYVQSLVAAQQQITANIAQQDMLDAQADAEFEMERQQKAAAWAQYSAAAEQGLADSISRLDDTVASVEAQQARYRAQQDVLRAQQETAQQQQAMRAQQDAVQYQEAMRAQQEAVQRQGAGDAAATGAPALVVSASPASATAVAAPAAAAGGTTFVFCVVVKPGAYMDAPGAMFLSAVSAVDRQAYSVMPFQDAFGARVAAQYGVSPGSGSCTSHPDRATAQARWQEQHDTVGLKFYRKVVTGIAATP